jgi:hypothetical protein
MPVPLTIGAVWHNVFVAWRNWHAGASERALAALDDDDLCHLSETGQKLYRDARRQCVRTDDEFLPNKETAT